MWSQPTNEEVLDELDEIEARISELEAKQTAFQTEIWEYVDGVLQPLNKRMATRLRRSEEKDLNTTETFKKGGLISPREAEERRKYGINK